MLVTGSRVFKLVRHISPVTGSGKLRWRYTLKTVVTKYSTHLLVVRTCVLPIIMGYRVQPELLSPGGGIREVRPCVCPLPQDSEAAPTLVDLRPHHESSRKMDTWQIRTNPDIW